MPLPPGSPNLVPWEEDIKPLPPWASKLISPYHYASALVVVSVVLAVAALALQINKAVVGEVEDAPEPEDGNNNATSLTSALRALGEHVWRRG